MKMRVWVDSWVPRKNVLGRVVKGSWSRMFLSCDFVELDEVELVKFLNLELSIQFGVSGLIRIWANGQIMLEGEERIIAEGKLRYKVLG